MSLESSLKIFSFLFPEDEEQVLVDNPSWGSDSNYKPGTILIFMGICLLKLYFIFVGKIYNVHGREWSLLGNNDACVLSFVRASIGECTLRIGNHRTRLVNQVSCGSMLLYKVKSDWFSFRYNLDPAWLLPIAPTVFHRGIEYFVHTNVCRPILTRMWMHNSFDVLCEWCL